MPKSDNQKLKIFYILDYLQRNSHQDHPVRATELIEMLQNRHDIRCERKTIYSDIAALQEYGMDIQSIPGKNGGYYIASRNFELPELKLLIDAVQSSRYLTEKKSRELIEKLCTQCNEHDSKLLRRNVLVSGRVKTMNETIYYNVDAIQEAISQNRQITFRYFDWDFGGKRKYREKEYLASPYGLCQDNENCYLLALSQRHGVTSYRVDRMSDIRICEESRLPCPELTGKALEWNKREDGRTPTQIDVTLKDLVKQGLLAQGATEADLGAAMAEGNLGREVTIAVSEDPKGDGTYWPARARFVSPYARLTGAAAAERVAAFLSGKPAPKVQASAPATAPGGVPAPEEGDPDDMPF